MSPHIHTRAMARGSAFPVHGGHVQQMHMEGVYMLCVGTEHLSEQAGLPA